jgi:hypothetical protein
MSSSKILGSDDDGLQSDMTIFRYERTTNENPFHSEDVSGSSCGMHELQWLQVDIHDGLYPKNLVPVSNDIKEDIAFHKRLEEWFGIDWLAVLAKNYNGNGKPFYDELRHLGSRPIETFSSSPPHSPSGTLRGHESPNADTTPTGPTKYLASTLASKLD